MELKEIWEQEGKELIKENFPISLRQWGMTDQEILDCMEESFIRGCEFEHNRSHWFDPEKVLPPKEAPVHDFSIHVLVKDEYENIWSDQWDYDKECWGMVLNAHVTSWAFIPK